MNDQAKSWRGISIRVDAPSRPVGCYQVAFSRDRSVVSVSLKSDAEVVAECMVLVDSQRELWAASFQFTGPIPPDLGRGDFERKACETVQIWLDTHHPIP